FGKSPLSAGWFSKHAGRFVEAFARFAERKSGSDCRGMQLEALQSLALSVAAARSPDSVLGEMVRGLGMTEGEALARVWLLRSEAGEPPYLELRASIGVSVTDPDVRWTRTDGAHRKIPLSYGKVGQIAATNQPLLLQRGPQNWILQPEWAEAERIES